MKPLLILTKAGASASTAPRIPLQQNCVKTALLFRRCTYPEHNQPDILKVGFSLSSETQGICHGQTKEASEAHPLLLLPFILCLLYIFSFFLILDLEWKKISPGQTC